MYIYFNKIFIAINIQLKQNNGQLYGILRSRSTFKINKVKDSLYNTTVISCSHVDIRVFHMEDFSPATLKRFILVVPLNLNCFNCEDTNLSCEFPRRCDAWARYTWTLGTSITLNLR